MFTWYNEKNIKFLISYQVQHTTKHDKAIHLWLRQQKDVGALSASINLSKYYMVKINMHVAIFLYLNIYQLAAEALMKMQEFNIINIWEITKIYKYIFQQTYKN